MKIIYSILSILILCSCNPKKQEDEKLPLKKAASSVVVKHTLPVAINSVFTKNVDDWKEYKIVEEFTSKFYKTSPNEALSNALEMKNVITHLKDSIKPVIFNTPSFNARINVLYNEAERLADITFIPAIETSEINNQVEKILQAFSALNSKINTVLSQKKFEDEIGKSSIDFIGLDTSKIDSISKIAIDVFDKKLKEEKIKSDKNALPDFSKKKGLKKMKTNN